MATYEEQTLACFEEELQSCRQEYRVSRQAWPGSDEALEMTVGSGRQCAMLLDRSSPLGAFSKILLGSSRWTNSEEFIYVWNRSDTKLPRHSLFQLTPLGQSTEGSGCLLWRSQLASDVTGGPMNGETRLAQGHTLNLVEQAATPKLWPTPIERDWKSTSHATKANSRPLSEVAGLTGSGSLNPRFVEQLMGFETGHTDLKHSETPLSRSKPTRSSKRSRKSVFAL